MRIIVAGSREIPEDMYYNLAIKLMIRLHYLHTDPRFGKRPTTIISGRARGADQMGEKVASFMGIPIEEFPADWKRHGKAAGPIRNEEMANEADGLIVVWDGESRGTLNMIGHMEKRKLPIHKIIFQKPVDN